MRRKEWNQRMNEKKNSERQASNTIDWIRVEQYAAIICSIRSFVIRLLRFTSRCELLSEFIQFLSEIISLESELQCMWHSKECAHEWRACDQAAPIGHEPWISLIYLSEKFIVCLEVMLRLVTQTNLTRTTRENGNIIFISANRNHTTKRYSFYVPFFDNNIGVAYSMSNRSYHISWDLCATGYFDIHFARTETLISSTGANKWMNVGFIQ